MLAPNASTVFNVSESAGVGHAESMFITGWVSQPNTRGTFDIVWSCLTTTFLCTWTVLCLNVPASSDSQWVIMARRTKWMLHCIAGPEFVTGFAAGQYENAYKAVAEFKEIGCHGWTMRHAFMADMGGFMLYPRDSKPFPVNNKHIWWLVVNKYLDFPDVSTVDIWDKSKADRLIKTLVCLQVCWLVLNVIARAIQNLAITTIELATVSIVFCTIATSVCWLHKPADVKTPIRLPCRFSTAEILLGAGDAAQKPYRMTPMDFVDNLGPSWSANVMAFARIRSGPQERPLPRFTNDRFPHVRGIRQFTLISVTLFGVGIHIFGWHFEFPSRSEQTIWRAASLVMFLTAAIFWSAEVLAGWHRDHIWELIVTTIFHPAQLKDLKQMRAQRPARTQPTPETFPLPLECGASATMWIFYLIARGYVLIEMFAGLRILPRSAFVSVEWANFLPHVT